MNRKLYVIGILSVITCALAVVGLSPLINHSVPEEKEVGDPAQGEPVVNSAYWKENIDNTYKGESTVNGVAVAGEDYVSFAVNVNDYRDEANSAETLSRLLDIYKKYGVKADFYFTEPVLRAYEEKSPSLIKKIKDSGVTINYHFRRPHPAYDYDDATKTILVKDNGVCKDIKAMSHEDKVSILTNFESYALNLDGFSFNVSNFCSTYDSGKVGGFDYVKKVFGTTPLVSGLNTKDDGLIKAELEVLKNKGLKMYIANHIGNLGKNPFATSYGLYERPADFGFSFIDLFDIYENKNNEKKEIAGLFFTIGKKAQKIESVDRPLFGLAVVHEADFYKEGGYMSDKHLSTDQKEKIFKDYEELVKQVSGNNKVKVINANDIIGFFENYEKTKTETTSSASKQNTGKPLIYLTVISHNEAESPRFDYYDTEEGYLKLRAPLLKAAEYIHSKGGVYHFQPDWRFLLAAQKYETGSVLNNTNDKNIVRYFYEDLGVHVDPHSHESNGYNYADVAYLITQLGVPVSKVIGGVTAFSDNPNSITWEKFRNPLKANKYDYTWTAEIIWGAGTTKHVGDEHMVSGVFRPKDKNNFLTHDPNANLINVGTCEDLDTLVNKLFVEKTLPQDKIYNCIIVMVDDYLLDQNYYNAFTAKVDKANEYVGKGYVQWASFEKIVEVWKNEYDEEPNNTYECKPVSGTDSCDLNKNGVVDSFEKTNCGKTSGGTTTNTKSSVGSTNTSGTSGKCGDGVCDDIEKSTGFCTVDCK